MNIRKVVLAAAAVTAMAGGLVFPAVQANAQVGINIVIGAAPPPVIYEPVPPPRAGYIWAPGFWAWDGHRHDWHRGHWERDRPGEIYTPARWERGPDGWRFHPSGWAYGRAEHGNRDHGDHDHGHGRGHDHDHGRRGRD